MPTLVSVFGVEPRRIGGTETFARELSLQLGERGWKSVLCFLSEPTEEVRRFLDLPNTSLDVYATTKDSSFKTGRKLATITRGYRPEILHLHFTGFLNFYSWLARLQSVKKVFFTDHHSRSAGYVPGRAPFWKRCAARFINRPLTNVICVSNYGYECMTAFDLLPQNRFKMIYNGVDLKRVKTDSQRALDFRRRYSIPPERAIVTQVSWVIPEKGISVFLETARLVTTQNRNVQFVLVGDGAYREQYMKDAAALGLEDRITWTGMVEDPFGEGVFSAADVVCQLSQWEELFGWMIAEGMAHSKPIVATRVGGIPELVSDGVSGFLVQRNDSGGAAEKLMRLVQGPELRREMGEAGRKLVADKFDLKTNVTQLVDLYEI
jgi:glycosyltransferase involved in cell wall biosynthesis